MKLSKAIQTNGALVDLATKDKENKLVFPSAIRYRLADGLSSLKPALENYQAQNNALVEKYGTVIPDQPHLKQVVQDSENWASFRKEFEDLLAEEVDVKIKTISQVELEKAETKDFRVDVPTIVSLRELGILVE